MALSRTRAARAARRRKRRMDSVEHDLTASQWDALQQAWAGCAYCGATGQPLQPACASCNTSKCNEEVTAWIRRTRRDERAFLLRYAQLRKSLESSS